MKHALTAFMVFIFFLATSAVAGDGMTLRGKGKVKHLGFIEIFNAALYTRNPDDTANILDPEISKCLRLEYKVSLAPEDFITGAYTVLRRQHPPETLNRVEQEISALHEAYRSVGKGDQYQLCYDGEKKVTTLLLNRQELIAIESPEFGNIYLGIWLGSREPIDGKMRDSLLYGRN